MIPQVRRFQRCPVATWEMRTCRRALVGCLGRTQPLLASSGESEAGECGEDDAERQRECGEQGQTQPSDNQRERLVRLPNKRPAEQGNRKNEGDDQS